MLLSAHALGLGSCVIKSFSTSAIKKILKLPDHVEPELLVSIGYPAEEPKPPARKQLSEVAYINR